MIYILITDLYFNFARPKWDKTTTPSQLERNERDAFLQWRRDLALYEIINNFTLS